MLELSHFSHVQLLVTPWTVACQVPLSMEFSRQEYWSGLPCPPPDDLSNPGIEPTSPALQVDSLPLNHWGSPNTLWKVKVKVLVIQSCLTLCDTMDCSPPGSSVHGSFQARVLEWGAIAFSILETSFINFYKPNTWYRASSMKIINILCIQRYIYHYK